MLYLLTLFVSCGKTVECEPCQEIISTTGKTFNVPYCGSEEEDLFFLKASDGQMRYAEWEAGCKNYENEPTIIKN